MRYWLLVLLMLAPLCRAADGEPLRVMTDLWPPFRMEGENGQLQGLASTCSMNCHAVPVCASRCSARPGHEV